MSKCATVAVIGRPSSGKSTLVNTICETKVSITSSAPHTTRNAIRGIYTDSRGQIIFTDTPGYQLSEKGFNKKMREIAGEVLEDTDLVLYVLDASRKPGDEENAVSYMLSGLSNKVICCINKKDILSLSQIESAREYLKKNMSGRTVLEISALVDDGIDELLIEIFKDAPEGPMLYGEEARTDQDLEFRVSEIIREKAINSVSQEIPQSIFVEISDMEYSEEEKKVWIRAFIIVERESQKGIVVGRGGENIKRIRVGSFKEIKKIFPGSKLELDLRVKADPKWKTNEATLLKVFRETQ